MANRFLSKPFERSTPSQRYPGLMLNLFGGGSRPLYTGFSEKKVVVSRNWMQVKRWGVFSLHALIYIVSSSPYKNNGLNMQVFKFCYWIHNKNSSGACPSLGKCPSNQSLWLFSTNNNNTTWNAGNYSADKSQMMCHKREKTRNIGSHTEFHFFDYSIAHCNWRKFTTTFYLCFGKGH